jgi:hypothetical protein
VKQQDKTRIIEAILKKHFGSDTKSIMKAKEAARSIVDAIYPEHHVYQNHLSNADEDGAYLCNCTCGWISSEYPDSESAAADAYKHIDLMESEDEFDVTWRGIIGDLN